MKDSLPNRPSNSTRRKAFQVVVDHGEAYGNIGEEAMILNALRRLELHLKPQVLHLVHQAGEPLPHGDNSKVRPVPSPLPAFREAAKRLSLRLSWLQRFSGIRRQGEAYYWRLTAKLDRLCPGFSGLRQSDEVRQFLRALDQSEVYYHVGMSGLNEFWEAGLAYKRWVLEQARRRGLMVVLSSQGLGPVSTASSRAAMQSLLQLADVVTLRDKNYGSALLKELGVTKAGSQIVFDEAFSLAPADAEITRQWLAKIGLGPSEAFIAFHYREKDYTPVQQDQTSRLGGLLQRIHAATKLSILFVPMSYSAHSSVDILLGQRLAESMANPAWYRVLPECRDPSIVKSVIGQARFSMGLSYHTNVFSLTQGHPALIIYTGRYYGLKSDELINFYCPPSRAMDLEKSSDDEILEAIDAIMNEYPAACRRIAAINEHLAGINDWVFEEIRRRLDS